MSDMLFYTGPLFMFQASCTPQLLKILRTIYKKSNS